MRRLVCIIIMAVMTMAASAEREEQRFNPQKFRMEQREFITREAKLTPQEAAKFFPLFNELQDKQRALFNRQRQLARQKPTSEKEAADIIEDMDEIDMQIAKLRTQYHRKFCKAIPATKVNMSIKAEERFKHRMMDKLMRRPNAPKAPAKTDRQHRGKKPNSK